MRDEDWHHSLFSNGPLPATKRGTLSACKHAAAWAVFTGNAKGCHIWSDSDAAVLCILDKNPLHSSRLSWEVFFRMMAAILKMAVLSLFSLDLFSLGWWLQIELPVSYSFSFWPIKRGSGQQEGVLTTRRHSLWSAYTFPDGITSPPLCVHSDFDSSSSVRPHVLFIRQGEKTTSIGFLPFQGQFKEDFQYIFLGSLSCGSMQEVTFFSYPGEKLLTIAMVTLSLGMLPTLAFSYYKVYLEHPSMRQEWYSKPPFLPCKEHVSINLSPYTAPGTSILPPEMKSELVTE